MKKVKIYTIAFNKPEFIPLQRKGFCQYLKDDFEFIVFNNSIEKAHDLKITEACAQLGIKCIDVAGRNPLAGPWASHSNALNWAFHNFMKAETDSLALLLDSDMFLINELSVNDYLQDYDLAAIPNHTGNLVFLQPILMFFDLDSLPHKDDLNFFCGQVEGVHTDTGGHLWYWLRDNPDLKIKYLTPGEELVVDPVGIVPEDIVNQYSNRNINRFVVIDQLFLHYTNSSNYGNYTDEYHAWKTTLISRFLEKDGSCD